MWPVPGHGRLELWRAAVTFISQTLALDNVTESMFEEVSKTLLPSGPGVKDEVLVRFKDARVRDSVIGSAARLAPFHDDSGRPTAGIRIEVPPPSSAGLPDPLQVRPNAPHSARSWHPATRQV